MKRLVVFALIFSLGHASVAFAAGPLVESARRADQQLAQTQGQPSNKRTKQQLQLLGVGAAVKLKLASGEKLRGSIRAIDADSLDLISRREGLPRRITYDEVTELKLAKLTYRSSGQPNAEEARRVVAGLGVGRHIAVKVTSGKKCRGHLQAINEDQFVLLLDREAKLVEIVYSDVQELGPNLSRGAKIAIIVGGVVVAVVVILAVALSNIE